MQTPVLGAAADGLRIGDRVWLRHAKGGELAERLTEYHLIDRRKTAQRPTYRGDRSVPVEPCLIACSSRIAGEGFSSSFG